MELRTQISRRHRPTYMINFYSYVAILYPTCTSIAFIYDDVAVMSVSFVRNEISFYG